MHKSLVIWWLEYSLASAAKKSPFLHSINRIILEENQNTSVKLQMADILIPNAHLSAYILQDDAQTSKLIEETQKKQEKILKLKEVNENCLRMVVQF